MTTSTSAQTHSSPFDFTPHPAQDRDLLRQLEFIPGLKEILMLRQVHALEHATVWVLSESGSPSDYTRRTSDPFNSRPVDNALLGGMSTDQGFYLYGRVTQIDLQRAVRVALGRITSGEWELALHPRCGTNVSVGMMLTAALAVGVHLLLPRGPIEQLLGLGLAATTAAQLAPDMGIQAQRYITTAIPFNLAVEDVTLTRDMWGRAAYFVRVGWCN